MTTADEAYRTAEAVTRDQAKNFYYGIRLLPPGKRLALCAVYALARRIDDIGDGDLPPDAKGAELGALRKQIEGLQGSADSADPVLWGVAAPPKHKNHTQWAISEKKKRIPMVRVASIMQAVLLRMTCPSRVNVVITERPHRSD